MKCFTMYKLFILCLVTSPSLGSYIAHVLKNPNFVPNSAVNFKFTHMAQDGTGTLFVGGTNYIHRIFSSNLTIEKSEVLGPELDNPNCYSVDYCEKEMKEFNSYMKALMILEKTDDTESDLLIICTSLFHGSCERRYASDLKLIGERRSLPIVANNETATTVAFLAPGPSDSIPAPLAMYVGVSWTNTGLKAIRSQIPAFSLRNLNNFDFFFVGLSSKSYVSVDEINRDSFPIRYIYGFSSDNFSYMGTIQKQSTTSDVFFSKLTRVCQDDKDFYSYAETELRCEFNGQRYNLLQTAHMSKPGSILAKALNIPSTEDVLFAMFAHGNPNDAVPPRESVMCIYLMRDVKSVFTRNIKKCFDGVGRTGPEHIASPRDCIKSQLKINDNYCGAYDINTPIDGPEAVIASRAISVTALATSIIVTTTHLGYTVAFVGTKNGHIKKIAIESNASAREYEDVPVNPGFTIHKDMYFDEDRKHLFVLTNDKLLKMAVQNCSQYHTCGECRGAKDPYCGWCSLDNKCTLGSDCDKYDQPLRWLGYSGETCTNITQVYPDKVQKDNKLAKTTTLTLNISNLPTYQGSYKCSFNGSGKAIETPANRTGPNVVNCNTPTPNELPPFPTGSDHIVMKLSVVIMGRNFVSTNFTFFDCEVHSKASCTRCTLSSYNCTWCIKNHHCTHYPVADCSTNDDFISGQNSAGLSIPHDTGPLFCPRIRNSRVNDILIPSGTDSRKIVVSGLKLKPYQFPIYCEFMFNSQTTKVIAKIADLKDMKMIECNKVSFFYHEDQKSYNVPMKIVWGDQNPKPLDNPTNIQVKMYKCEKMAGTCGECLTQDVAYNCGWCKQGDTCSLESNCVPRNQWLNSQRNCPNPTITRIYPLSGPKEGGTLLTIEGKDLGKEYKDIVSNVDIAGVQCSPIRDYYVPSVKIVCTTGKMVSRGERSDHVRVTVDMSITTQSGEMFTYVNPVISDMMPRLGPKSGGTKVAIFGKHLDAGTEKKIYFGPEDECILIQDSITSAKLSCMTSRVNKSMTTPPIYMRFDKQIVTSQLTYQYVDDPNITNVQRKISFVSGGLSVRVDGNGFSSITAPKMVFYHNPNKPDRKTFFGDCRVIRDTFMECNTPLVDIPLMEPKARMAFGFIMDNVKAVQNLSDRHGYFDIYPDPIITKFPNDQIKNFQWKSNEFLTLSGMNLVQLQLTKEDVTIKIGKGDCNVTSASEQITCRPPKSSPSSLKNSKFPEVEVTIGNNLTFMIGYLKYDESEFPLPLEYIILISAGGGFLFIAVIVVIIMYRMKSKKNNSMMKKMQIQMDNLESKVAKECKEAFVVLQTDMEELMNDISGQSVIPFWDYRSYCMRVLFPQDQEADHAVIKELEVDYARKENVEKGLKLFSQLINNKTFLLIFVRTLESNKQFKMRDRVNVASLISVALQTKMEYATDILKTLLAELIEKSVDGKNHPKLLLRRTESVAEKMLTNWFTFLLYKFLRDCAGEPLFMLYQAMKQQVSKGPVDMCTSEARYSLSEDKLIRQQLDYKQMTIYVHDMQEYASPHPVRVLDCDTISQVKEKILDAIYKNAPFSSRPVKEDVDLVLFDQSGTPPEWSNGVKGRLILQDDDSTTRVEGEYKRMNTLAHYKVQDNALMSLVEKQPPSYNNLSLTNSEKSSRFYVPEKFQPHHTRTSSFQRTVSPPGVHIDGLENYGVKFYHLVKQHDNDPTGDGNRGSKMVSEIYLTRLLATKGTLQQYVDDLLERIFSTAHRGTALPLAIKYMFDFLDDQALLHNIMDAEVVHTWKSNSLPLRFWVNVIKNPNFVFDIYKSNIVDSCLSVVAQTFMDSCSISEHRLGINSPSSKLLYAKDIPKYKKWVERYYQDIKMMPAISDQDMTAMLTDESRQHADEFNTTAALYELYRYIQQYYDAIYAALEEDEFAKKNRLTYRLEQVRMSMEQELYC